MVELGPLVPTMELRLCPADVMRLLEYSLNELEFKGRKTVTGIKVNKGTGDMYVVTIAPAKPMEDVQEITKNEWRTAKTLKVMQEIIF